MIPGLCRQTRFYVGFITHLLEIAILNSKHSGKRLKVVFRFGAAHFRHLIKCLLKYDFGSPYNLERHIKENHLKVGAHEKTTLLKMFNSNEWIEQKDQDYYDCYELLIRRDKNRPDHTLLPSHLQLFYAVSSD